MKNPPFVFIGPYANAYIVPRMAMDPRHVFILYDVLRSYPFRQTLELGSFQGASSAAFVEAINAGSGFVATFCDTEPSEGLWDTLANCRWPERTRVTKQKSWEVLESLDAYDLIFVDANHDIASVTEEVRRLVPRRPLCVMAHDTNATRAGYPSAEGAAFLAGTFRGMAGYHCIEDCVAREGEETARGLFLATTDEGLLRVAKEVFKDWR